MNGTQFDALTTLLAAQRSRRGMLRSAGATLAATALGAIGLGHAAAQGATPAATPGASPVAGCAMTTETQNAAIARRWTEDMLTGQNLAVLDEILSPDITYDAGVFPVLHGRKAVVRAMQALLTAFPDGRYTVDQVITEHDLVAVRWTAMGTHRGTFLGVPATGNAVTWTGINIYRIACGQIAAGWSEADGVAILQQVGVLPATPAAAAAASPVASPMALATSAACASTSLDENEAIVRRYFVAWGKGDVAAFARLFAPGAVHHWGQGADTTGPEAFQRQVSGFFSAFPDLTFTLDLMFGQGNLVVARWTAKGTHKGRFFGIAPTGHAVTWAGNNIFRFECGRIAESWSETDGLGLRKQLGVLPNTVVPASTPAS